MPDLLDDVDRLLTPLPHSVRGIYDRVAPSYAQFRATWIKLAGADVEGAMLGDLAAILQPGARVLDAGAGTGALSRRMLGLQPDLDLTLLDLSPAMLAQAADVRATQIEGSVLDLPFPDDAFDVVVSGWVIETVPDPLRAVSEYLRVIRPTGYVLYTFCSLPAGWVSRAGTALLRTVVENRFAGHFLPPEETPWHDCERSRRRKSHTGLTTYVLLRKCCPIGAAIVPIPMGEIPEMIDPVHPSP